MRRLSLVAAATLALTMPAWAQDAGATAKFISADGNELGEITLTQAEGGVVVKGTVTSITPGEHGIHFHETGDCDAASAFETAGGHFNPTSHQHGLDNPEGPHAGDLPNVTADGQGNVALDFTTDTISLTEGDDGYVFDDDGTALIIHADPDDNVTDPSGNSGDRITCAVIEAAQ
jgi:Cu-Zn family superoxide dismutase